ncbi:unnamed protein product [Ixodes pacificus]
MKTCNNLSTICSPSLKLWRQSTFGRIESEWHAINCKCNLLLQHIWERIYTFPEIKELAPPGGGSDLGFLGRKLEEGRRAGRKERVLACLECPAPVWVLKFAVGHC